MNKEPKPEYKDTLEKAIRFREDYENNHPGILLDIYKVEVLDLTAEGNGKVESAVPKLTKYFACEEYFVPDVYEGTLVSEREIREAYRNLVRQATSSRSVDSAELI